MKSLYSKSVVNVPTDYNEPTKAYKKHVWIAVAGILSFFIFYLYLTYWFFFSAYRLLYGVYEGGADGLTGIGVGLASLFLGIFMIKGFFFLQTKYDVQDRQIKPEDEPVLFDYLHQLADEIGAPRPNKVYLSNRVNASVFYDLSFLNLFFPSKKNLEIGLGLINVLNLGEFKAVLAHEFGHFAQKSMLVGRWVYIANQIANTIITKRDALDSFLIGLSSIDIRIAWIGWILSIIVWSIRSLVELIFRVVVLSQRALSREMEFQADLVAVSVTGSDALIHALHKLQAADAAFSNALVAVNEQLGQEKGVEDIYVIQTNAIQKTAAILNDEEYGKSPSLPAENPEQYRVFSDKIAQPPKMWATHPPDQERESNAKKRYISGNIDDRSAWDLFKNPQQTKLLLTADLIKTAEVKTELISTAEVLSIHNKQFEKSYFNPKYKGIYLNRFFCQEYENSEDVYLKDLTKEQSVEKINELYPESLVENLEDFTTLREEVAQLEAIKENRLSASGSDGIWHRGTQIRKKELPEVIGQLHQEMEVARLRVADHDRLCRTVHVKLAKELGVGWDDYLKGLLSVIHYAEHNINNINDAHHILGRVLGIVMADNKVSSSEMSELLAASNDLHLTLYTVFKNKSFLNLDENLLDELGVKGWNECLENFTLGRADQNNINEWIQVISGWVESYVGALYKLRSEALEVLLNSEEQVQKMVQSGTPQISPARSVVNTDFQRMLPGQERPLTLKLNLWDRFISADGMVPAVAKFAVAASIVGATVFMAGSTNQSDLSIYNGLGQAMIIDVDGQEVYIDPHSYKTVAISDHSGFEISSSTEEGELVEAFQPDFSSVTSHYIYNIASAAGLYEYTIYYGGTPRDGYENHGNQRWMRTSVDYIFYNPPETIQTSSNSTTRDALTALSDVHPNNILNMLLDVKDQQSIIKAHILWDPVDSENMIYWLGASFLLEDSESVIKARMKKNPNEIMSARLLMDQGDEALRAEVCDDFSKRSIANPDDPDLYYIAARCLADDAQKNQKYIDGAKKWPDHGWMSYAVSYTYAQNSDWVKSHDALLNAYDNLIGLKDPIAQRVERLARLLDAQGKTVKRITDADNQYLQYYLSLESGEDKEPYNYVYHLMNQGSLQEAKDLMIENELVDTNLIVLLAASDGAKEEWISEALEINSESFNDASLYALVGLYLRKGKDISKLTSSIENLSSSESVSISEFIEHLRRNNYDLAEKIMKQGGVAFQGHVSVLAYVAQGNRIPKEWKSLAQHLLFASEKPYIKK